MGVSFGTINRHTVHTERCEDNTPTGEMAICGDMATMEALSQYEIDGTMDFQPCSCNFTLAQIEQMCSNLAPDCLVEECPGDEDCDGVPDEWDMCPNTPRGTIVDQFGCAALEQHPDEDDDGVPDVMKTCARILHPVLLWVLMVVKLIIQISPITLMEPGDEDNDNALLEGIINWLKKINSNTDNIEENQEELQDTLDKFTDDSGMDSYEDDPAPVEKDEEGFDEAIDDFLSDIDNLTIQDFLRTSRIENSGGSSTICVQSPFSSDVVCSDLADFQSYFQLAGNLLFAFTSIMAGIYLFKS